MPDRVRTRRGFVRAGLGLAGLGLLAGCTFAPPWHQTPRVPRIGFLARADWPSARIQGFKNGLADRGYVEGENITVEWRWAPETEDLPAMAAELVHQKVDVIVAASTLAIQAARNATSTIPIVMSASGDPVGTGLVASLARPGGNVTGLSNLAVGLSAKRIELFKEAVPAMARLGVFWDPSSPDKQNDFRETQAAADSMGVQVRQLEVRSLQDLDATRTAVATEPLDALLTLMDGYVAEVVEIAVRAGLPAMCEARGFTMAGGLMSYGPNPLVWYGRAVDYVEKILKGAPPPDLPVEQPTDIELVVNQKTARSIGFTIPSSVLAQAREIIE